jgi:ribosomal protein S18 acetylase RimI-like enzyme
VAVPVEIRSFHEKDELAVTALWHVVFPDDPPHNEPAALIRRKLQVQPELFFVALAEEQLAGTLLAGYDGHRGWLYHLAVAPERRRAGIGRALVEHAEARLLDLGCPKVNLQVRESNRAASGFYTALGYGAEARVSLGKRLSHEPH